MEGLLSEIVKMNIKLKSIDNENKKQTQILARIRDEIINLSNITEDALDEDVQIKTVDLSKKDSSNTEERWK